MSKQDLIKIAKEKKIEEQNKNEDLVEVTKIEKEESYKSDDKNTIDYLKKSNELNYSNLKDVYGGYDYEIKSDKISLNINTTIALDNVDIKQMVKDNLIDSDYVVSNKLTISGAKYFYKEKGANCDI